MKKGHAVTAEWRAGETSMRWFMRRSEGGIINRRQWLKLAGVTGVGLAGGSRLLGGPAVESPTTRPRSNAAELPRREYGKTGVMLSIIGFPGYALKELEQERVQRMVSQAVERGVNYFDVAPQYGDAEQRLGPALEPYRKNVFLACKTAGRKKEEAAADLKTSLERLRTDHFDLYQLHHIGMEPGDTDRAFAKGGAMEVLIQAKKEGRVRFLGFSAHSIEAALTAMDRYDFDSALIPVNYASVLKGGWGPQIMAKARQRGVAILALKALARQKWPNGVRRLERYRRCWYEPITDLDEADLSLRWTLSQEVVAAIPPAAEFLWRPTLDLAMDYAPITQEEEQELKARAEKLDPVFSTLG